MSKDKGASVVYTVEDTYKGIVISGQIKYSNDKVHFIISHQLGDLFGYKFFVHSILFFPNKYSGVSGIRIECDELDYIYDTRKSIVSEKSSFNNGAIKLELHDTMTNISEEKQFTYRGISVKYSFSIYRKAQYTDINYPVKLNSVFSLFFDETNDYTWIYEVFWIAFQFIRYLCYRQNIQLSEAKLLFGPDKEGLYSHGGKIIIDKRFLMDYIEKESVAQKKYIEYEPAKNVIHKILQLIADDNIYLLHIPHSSEDRRYISPSRILLICAAFEWEYKQAYGESTNQERIVLSQEVIQLLNSNFTELTGKKKSLYKGYVKSSEKFFKDKPLSSKIITALNDFDDILFPHIRNHIISIDDRKSKNRKIYNQIGHNIESIRNKYAHGEINRDVNKGAAFDTRAIEWLVYCMQLKRAGLPSCDIAKIIEKLFQL